ncbi:MAG: SAP30-binding protein, partial [Paramarteilia canceri]
SEISKSIPLVNYEGDSESSNGSEKEDDQRKVSELSKQNEDSDHDPIIDETLLPIEDECTLENLTSYGCKSKCSVNLQEKVNNMNKFIESKGINFNQYISSKKEFNNPSINEKLIKHLGIDERGSYFFDEYNQVKDWCAERDYKKISSDQMNFWNEQVKESEKKGKVLDQK